jgi:hypothetical protein
MIYCFIFQNIVAILFQVSRFFIVCNEIEKYFLSCRAGPINITAPASRKHFMAVKNGGAGAFGNKLSFNEYISKE